MKTFIKLFAIATTLFISSTPVFSQTDKNNSIDSLFIVRNLADNFSNIAIAQLGEQKSNDEEIKKAAKQIITDHSEIINELKRIGAKLEIKTAETIATNTVALKELESKPSPAFEKLWLTEMIGRHESKIEELENTSAQINNAELRSAASRALQKIKIHKDMLVRIKYKYK